MTKLILTVCVVSLGFAETRRPPERGPGEERRSGRDRRGSGENWWTDPSRKGLTPEKKNVVVEDFRQKSGPNGPEERRSGTDRRQGGITWWGDGSSPLDHKHVITKDHATAVSPAPRAEPPKTSPAESNGSSSGGNKSGGGGAAAPPAGPSQSSPKP